MYYWLQFHFVLFYLLRLALEQVTDLQMVQEGDFSEMEDSEDFERI